MQALTLIQAVNEALKCEMRIDSSVIVFGEDVGLEGGVFRATVDLQQEFGIQRCFDTPLAEAAIAGTALGMAMNGLKPVVEMQFSGFFWPAFNQVACHISRIRNRSRGAFSAPLVIRMPYGGGIRALEHHSESNEAIYSHLPGLKVVIPSTPYDAKGLLIAAIRDPDPVIFMEPKRVYRSVRQEVPDEAYVIPIGKARIVQSGSDLTLISWGAQMKEAQAAAGILKGQGVSVELIDLRTISPWDRESVSGSVKKTGRLLVVHEGPRTCGVGAEIITSAMEDCFYSLQAAPVRLTGADTIFPLPRAEHHYMITTEHITTTAKKLLAEKA